MEETQRTRELNKISASFFVGEDFSLDPEDNLPLSEAGVSITCHQANWRSRQKVNHSKVSMKMLNPKGSEAAKQTSAPGRSFNARDEGV